MTWRFVHSGACPPALNMGTDEALLRLYRPGHTRPILRTYGWDPPAISLGYFQAAAAVASLPPALRAQRVVRRLTGGGAIYHHCELTYALVLAESDSPRAVPVRRLYDVVHRAIIRLLADLGVQAFLAEESAAAETPSRPAGSAGGRRARPFFCFARQAPFDVLVSSAAARHGRGMKIAGSAQRRIRGVVLQHGSILLNAGARSTNVGVGLAPPAWTVARALTRQEVGVNNIVPRALTLREAADALRGSLADALSVEFDEVTLTPEESAEARRLAREKYLDDTWTVSRAGARSTLGGVRIHG